MALSASETFQAINSFPAPTSSVVASTLAAPSICQDLARVDRRSWSGKDKLFFFASYERLQAWSSRSPTRGLQALTALRLATVAAPPGVSATNLDIYRHFVPVAATNKRNYQLLQHRPDQDGICPTAQICHFMLGR